MSIIDKAIHYFVDKDYRFLVNRNRGLLDGMSDEEYLKRLFHAKMGYDLELNNPRTYSEKLQWLKLYDRRPIYTTMVDKYAVKEYVAGIIGEEYVIPTIGIYSSAEEIDFDTLPDQFVLKCTHDSHDAVICKDRKALDIDAAIQSLREGLKTNYYYKFREWPYKNVPPRIIAEKYMEDTETGELRDYKIFAFNGTARALFIATDRQTDGVETKFDFFDMDFNHLPFTNGHPNADVMPSRPRKLDEMKLLAEKLSRGIPQVRVDFYEVDGRVYFGEMTFFHWSGLQPYDPKEWDETFGSWIELPERYVSDQRTQEHGSVMG